LSADGALSIKITMKSTLVITSKFNGDSRFSRLKIKQRYDMNVASQSKRNEKPASVSGNILTPQGWLFGTLHYAEKILAVEAAPQDPASNQAAYIVPGFIDLHVHGGAGQDIMQGGAASGAVAQLHARYGTTSLLATTMTAPQDELVSALHGIAAEIKQRSPQAARVLGVHLEGPYINPGKLGAQPDCAQAGNLQAIAQLHAIAPIRVLTLAPEIDGHVALIGAITAMGIKVQLGHSLGSYEDALAALAQGASGFTHLYNAMSRLDHRAPGMVGAALAHAEFAELIPDLLHVHPGAIKAALRAIPHLYCVTDSTAATGMPDGEYLLGRQVVHKCMGGVRLADGTLAGSTLTMDQALRNLVAMGLELADAARRVSTYAADYLGIAGRGRIQVGSYADLVVLDRALQLTQVLVEGERITNI
jgi:N-acetylglucosamine-6-phosphate deacetylase